MEWNKLTDESQLAEIVQISEMQPVLIFKHSTRCSISSTAKDRLERNWKTDKENTIMPFYLDLIAHRNISNAISVRFAVLHESPQVLLIKGGRVVHKASHMSINFDTIVKHTL